MHDLPESLDLHDDLGSRRSLSRGQALVVCLIAIMGCAVSAALCALAVVMHPPVAVVPLLAIVCVGCPVFGTWELPSALAELRARPRRDARAIARFRSSLAALPEIEHPLGH